MSMAALHQRILLPVALAVLMACGQNPPRADEPAAPPAAQQGAPAQQHANRLAGETSPYLLLHAHNPVDWYPWGPEAFEAARRENKLIFLSIGYSSCFWCHVMERKVFSDPEIAAQMNEKFINVKVDREERPDVDDIYMTALQVYLQVAGAGGSGGWPLSMFLTPEGEPIAGGTYFPPETEGGRIGFPSVIEQVDTAWQTRRQDVQRTAQILATHVRQSMEESAGEPVELTGQLIEKARAALTKSFDAEYGGVDFDPLQPHAPKFPVPTKLAFLQAAREPVANLEKNLHGTLDAILRGGIRDHLGGGFHRYSTDRRWHVPHFEKMLYDNAQLADVYVTAYQQTGDERYRLVAEQTYEFLLRDMRDATGGFHTALDAETDGIEGQHYVWTREEIGGVLGDEDAELFFEVYGLNEEQVFEHGYVLHLSAPLRGLAAAHGTTWEQLEAKLEPMRKKLLAVRQERPKLLKDDKILTSWNGLVLHALARGGEILGRPDLTAAARQGADFLLDELRDEKGNLLRTARDGQAKLNAYLDDYAFLAQGLLELHRQTGEERWFAAARELTDRQIDQFWDDAAGGFYFTSDDHESLIARPKNVFDAVLPSGNSVSVRNLVRLAEQTGERAYRDHARRTLEAFSGQLRSNPSAMATMALALQEFLASEESATEEAEPDREAVSEVADETAGPVFRMTAKPPITPAAGEQAARPAEKVKAQVYLSKQALPAGGTCEVAARLTVEDGWHINQNPAQPDFLIPTALSLGNKTTVKLAKVEYPQGKTLKMAGIGDVKVYEGTVYLFGILDVPEALAGKTEELVFKIRYQACNDQTCLAPKDVELGGRIRVAQVGEQVQPANAKIFEQRRKDREAERR